MSGSLEPPLDWVLGLPDTFLRWYSSVVEPLRDSYFRPKELLYTLRPRSTGDSAESPRGSSRRLQGKGRRPGLHRGRIQKEEDVEAGEVSKKTPRTSAAPLTGRTAGQPQVQLANTYFTVNKGSRADARKHVGNASENEGHDIAMSPQTYNEARYGDNRGELVKQASPFPTIQTSDSSDAPPLSDGGNPTPAYHASNTTAKRRGTAAVLRTRLRRTLKRLMRDGSAPRRRVLSLLHLRPGLLPADKLWLLRYVLSLSTGRVGRRGSVPSGGSRAAGQQASGPHMRGRVP